MYLVSITCIIILLISVTMLAQSTGRALIHYYRHLQTKDIDLEIGQHWISCCGDPYEITCIDDDEIGLRSFNCSWSESMKCWKRRIKDETLYMVRW